MTPASFSSVIPGMVVEQGGAVSDPLRAEHLDGGADLRGRAALPGVHRPAEAQSGRALERRRVIRHREQVPRAGSSREIDPDDPGPGRGDVDELHHHGRVLPVEPAEHEAGAPAGPFERRVDDGPGSCAPVELRGEPDLQGRHAFVRGVLAHLGGDAADGGRLLQQGEREREPGERGIEAHAGREREVRRHRLPCAGGELGERRPPYRPVQMTVQIGEGWSLRARSHDHGASITTQPALLSSATKCIQ
jgi:hypothetical protein